MVGNAYEEELKQFEERKRADIEETRGQAREAVRGGPGAALIGWFLGTLLPHFYGANIPQVD